MLSDYTATLAEARTCIAALADRATSIEASCAYERTLLYLDAIHGDAAPALEPAPALENHDALQLQAEAAVEGLLKHGIDALQVEMLLAMLDDAHQLDTHS